MRLGLRQSGLTLFEVLVYIGLLAIILGGAMLGAYQLIEGSVRTATRVATEEEANFIFRKIDWALNGDVTVNEPDAGETTDELDVTKPGEGALLFDVNDDDALTLNGDALTSRAISITEFVVERTPASEPDAVSVSFVMNGRQFATTTRYVR
ncbi:prepilin-type N-terminal cleavage/methylation domain-containing protein [Candidatus Wolfebacteria bacterium]|nr:prepilin-type N-terminal cleavage/methylation domain-containing protein [Candidatus Wolfebacteria bacterium]